MSAWIEMYSSLGQEPSEDVALYVSAWIEINIYNTEIRLGRLVALYVSAWIEIDALSTIARVSWSHST